MYSNPTQRFLRSSNRLVNHFGTLITYTRKGEEVFDEETQTVSSTDTTLSFKAFKYEVLQQEVKSPNLIGKEISAFNIAASDINFKPKSGDIIQYSIYGELVNLEVVKVTEHWAGDSVSLWKVWAISL